MKQRSNKKSRLIGLLPPLLVSTVFADPSSVLALKSSKAPTACAATAAQPGLQATSKKATTLQPAKAATRTVPAWWRQEWTRRQQMMRIEHWDLARERQTDSKQMWNPRSPQALAFRNAGIYAHGGSIQPWLPPKRQSVNSTSTRAVSVQTHAKAVNSPVRR